jgi:oxidase EvaA
VTAATARPAGAIAGGVAARMAESARREDGAMMPSDLLPAWLERHRDAKRYRVTRIPFADLVGWQFDQATGDLAHESGRFFSVEGLRVRTDTRPDEWTQPIINQPEIGILGLLTREFDGVPHFLMQAKMEPGNVNTIQLSPTVQATRSNYTGVHGGRPITYLEHFAGRGAGRVIADSLQSEQGSWFLRKRNRNMIVEATGDVPEHDDFCWLTLGQVRQLLGVSNAINMDARTVLSCLPLAPAPGDPALDGDGYAAALLRSLDPDAPALHTDLEVRHFLTAARTRHELVQRTVPLREVAHWHRTDDEITHDRGEHFSIIAADVAAAGREVAWWTQPLLAPTAPELSALLVRPFDGILHLLLRVTVEPGLTMVAEFGPTVQCPWPDGGPARPAAGPPFLDDVLAPPPGRLLHDSTQSEEGGRFYLALNRYRIVLAPDAPAQPPPDYLWVTPGQATRLLRHGCYLNIQSRTLLSCLQSTW